MGDVLGGAWVSTGDQDLSVQGIGSRQAGAVRVVEDARSGWSMDREGLTARPDDARRGDTLAVMRLDRLGRSLNGLLAIAGRLWAQGSGLSSLEERIGIGAPAGAFVLHVSQAGLRRATLCGGMAAGGLRRAA